VIFGHTHRTGPLDRDERHAWFATFWASPLNTGCWVLEPAFVGSAPRERPYRAGFGAVVSDDGPPELVNLL
jgi:hypothetical protein